MSVSSVFLDSHTASLLSSLITSRLSLHSALSLSLGDNDNDRSISQLTVRES